MTDVTASMLRPVIVGANHRSSALAVRDALFVDDAAQAAFLADLGRAGLSQVMVLSTCDRVELWAMHHDAGLVEAVAVNAFARHGGLPAVALQGQLYTLTGREAARHAFSVAASLDSLVIGEPHVLGQVKACQRMAREAGTMGPELENLLAAAYGAAKRVRSETEVGERPVSIASAAVQSARDLHGDLSASDGLLLGAGDMGELVAEALLAAGLRRLVVAAHRQSRAEAVAQSLNCHVGDYGDLPGLLAEADIVVTAVGGRLTLLSPDLVHQALRRRRRKPVFLVDTGIPGDVDPAVNRVDGAFLYDLTDLERAAMAGRASREQAAREAWTILDQEVTAFSRHLAERAAVPAIVALRGRFGMVREQVLTEAGEDCDKATRLLIHRLLHDPSEMMKELAAAGGAAHADWEAAERLLKRLFRL
ncbi:glutamyl-tRNA reductase [mine drainage metagenome]|uniref:glutamyl-tRNA reductase n=1 Tax=mine drainage metagenome TaxID=410659 RepID=A0A1J5RL97_9ZZZZ